MRNEKNRRNVESLRRLGGDGWERLGRLERSEKGGRDVVEKGREMVGSRRKGWRRRRKVGNVRNVERGKVGLGSLGRGNDGWKAGREGRGWWDGEEVLETPGKGKSRDERGKWGTWIYGRDRGRLGKEGRRKWMSGRVKRGTVVGSGSKEDEKLCTMEGGRKCGDGFGSVRKENVGD